MKIEHGSVVAVNFQLHDANSGELLDDTTQGDPITYLHGAEDLLEGLENALEGKEKGDKFQVELQPEHAFGESDDSMIDRVPRENFPGVDTIEVGMQFQTEVEGGGAMVVRVVEVSDTEVVVDANHELAGRALRFDVEVMSVRQASDEEMEHGHVHGSGAHHH